MKLLDIVTCAGPVLFANENAEFPYSVGGTAFIVKFQGRSFVITAKHVAETSMQLSSAFSIDPMVETSCRSARSISSTVQMRTTPTSVILRYERLTMPPCAKSYTDRTSPIRSCRWIA